MRSTRLVYSGRQIAIAPPVQIRLAELLDRLIYPALIVLVILVAVPNGTIDAREVSRFESVVFTLTALWVIEGFIAGSWQLNQQRLLLPLVGLLLLAAIQALPLSDNRVAEDSVLRSAFLSVDQFQTRLWILRTGAVLLTGALLLRFTSSERRLQLLVFAVIAVGVGSALFGIVRQVGQLPLPLWQEQIAPAIGGYGQFVNQNHFALLMEMTFGLLAGLIAGTGLRRIFLPALFLAIAIVWAALVFANSRGGILTMVGQVVITAIGFCVLALRRKRVVGSYNQRNAIAGLFLKGFVAIVLVLTMTVGAFVLGGDSLVRRFEVTPRELSSETPTRDNSHRLAIWRTTLVMIRENPIVGVGFGAYETAVPKYHDASGRWIPEAAHNDYLELIASGGIVALALLIWFLVLLARCVSERIRESLEPNNQFLRAARFGALVGLSGVAIHSFVDFGLHITANALICSSLVVIATRKIAVPRSTEVRSQ